MDSYKFLFLSKTAKKEEKSKYVNHLSHSNIDFKCVIYSAGESFK
ncbi:hypothetical protein ZORO111903_19350 [Zobellia roscoffensis]